MLQGMIVEMLVEQEAAYHRAVLHPEAARRAMLAYDAGNRSRSMHAGWRQTLIGWAGHQLVHAGERLCAWGLAPVQPHGHGAPR